MRSERTRVLVEIALVAALSFVLGMFKLWEMPQGGSVSLEMLPIIVLALLRGVRPAVVAGFVAGMLGALLHPVIVGWIQFLADYPLAYAAVGLAGVFAPVWRTYANRARSALGIVAVILPATLLGAIARYACHVASGYFFFGEYAPAGQPVVVYSLIYNSFVLVAAALVFVAAAAVVPTLSRTKLFAGNGSAA